jgi:hypothetical protein
MRTRRPNPNLEYLKQACFHAQFSWQSPMTFAESNYYATLSHPKTKTVRAAIASLKNMADSTGCSQRIFCGLCVGVYPDPVGALSFFCTVLHVYGIKQNH